MTLEKQGDANYMQELIPINETEFVAYDHETKEYLPVILNIREMQMLILEELQDYTTDVRAMKVTLTPTYKQLTNLRERIVEITANNLVEIYIMKDCIKVQIPVKVKTDQIAQIDEIFGVNGVITYVRYGDVLIIEYKVDK